MTEYEKPEAGEWVKPKKRGYLMACCDCGLVHRMDFDYVKDSIGRIRIGFRAWRDEKETRKLRKAKRIAELEVVRYKGQDD